MDDTLRALTLTAWRYGGRVEHHNCERGEWQCVFATAGQAVQALDELVAIPEVAEVAQDGSDLTVLYRVADHPPGDRT